METTKIECADEALTLYFLGVKESHFVYRPVKVLSREIDVEKV